MNVNTEKMTEYAEFLNTSNQEIINICNQIGEKLAIAIQCMDQESGRAAAHRMAVNLDNIMKTIPLNNNASERLVLSKKLIDNARNVFGGR